MMVYTQFFSENCLDLGDTTHLKAGRTILTDQRSENGTGLTSLNDLIENLFLYLQIEREITDTSFECMLKIEEIYMLTKKRNYFK